MGIKKELGKKIRQLRYKNNLTQEMLAEKLNISSKSLSQIERGNNFVSAETLEVLCEALNITPKAIFDFKEPKNNENDLIGEISNRLKNNPALLDTIYKITITLDEQ